MFVMSETKWEDIDEIYYDDAYDIKDGEFPDYMHYYIASFVRLNGKWGIIRHDGSVIFSPRWDECEEMKTGYTCKADLPGQFNAWGYPLEVIDDEGWHYADLKDTYYFIKVKSGNQYGVVDTFGREITPCKWDEIDDCGNVRQGDRWGYVDLLTGGETPPQWPENQHLSPAKPFWTMSDVADGFGWLGGAIETMTLFLYKETSK